MTPLHPIADKREARARAAVLAVLWKQECYNGIRPEDMDKCRPGGPLDMGGKVPAYERQAAEIVEAVLATAEQQRIPEGEDFRIGARVEKKSGSSWRGLIVGSYSTALTPIGWAVESETETGSVQIYPEKALRLAALSPDTVHTKGDA